MATSRTGTTRYKKNRATVLRQAQRDGITHCPRCNILLDYTIGKRPNSAETDHVQPHAQGGNDSTDNLSVLCRRCNQTIGAKRPRQQIQREHVETIDFTT